jgi:hypothetical protein
MENISFDLYRLFYIVANSKTISEAAAKMYITQPAVTQGMKKLEDQIGGKLDIEGYLDRPGRETQMRRSIYNYEAPYGSTLVDTTANVNDGQYFVGQQIGQKNV